MPMSPRLLRPRQTIHPEAADWAKRVRTNGGSVSGTTLSAVDRFVKAIHAAGIRDRFYRLNLFCGNSDASLNAVRTPLFRNWSAYAGRNLLSSGDNLTLSTWTKSGTTTAISSSERPFTYGPFASVVTAVAGTGVTPHVVNSANNYGYGTVTVSAYLKANGQNTVRILPVGSSGMTFPGGGAVAFATINLSNGAISNVLSGTTATATSVGNGWYRLAYTFTNNGVGNMGIRFDVGGGSSYNATGSESFFIWGIQSELGSSASAYEPFPLGDTTDTNVNFVAGDYAETGASGGLLGDGSTKYLNTGFNVSGLPGAANCHLAAYIRGTQSISSARTLVGTLFNGTSDRYRLFLNNLTASFYRITSELGKSTQALLDVANADGGLLVSSRTSTTNVVIYNDGVAGTANTTSTAEDATGNVPFFVFARNGPTEYYNGRMAGYSIGAGMTAAQVNSYYAAMQTFQTAMNRAAT